MLICRVQLRNTSYVLIICVSVAVSCLKFADSY